MDTCSRLSLSLSSSLSTKPSRRARFPASSGEIRMNVCESVDLERSSCGQRRADGRVSARCALSRRTSTGEGREARRFLGYCRGPGEPFSPLSGKTNIRSRWKVTTRPERWREGERQREKKREQRRGNAHVRPPGAATAGGTEVLLLRGPFVPPTSPRSLSSSPSRSHSFATLSAVPCTLLHIQRGRSILASPSGVTHCRELEITVSSCVRVA